jgi:hypothetical protein
VSLSTTVRESFDVFDWNVDVEAVAVVDNVPGEAPGSTVALMVTVTVAPGATVPIVHTTGLVPLQETPAVGELAVGDWRSASGAIDSWTSAAGDTPWLRTAKVQVVPAPATAGFGLTVPLLTVMSARGCTVGVTEAELLAGTLSGVVLAAVAVTVGVPAEPVRR